MASAETNPSNPPLNHASLHPTIEPFVIQINPSTPPLTHPLHMIHPAIEPLLNLQPSSSPPPPHNHNHASNNIRPLVDPISIPPPKPSSMAQENQGLNNMQPNQTHYMSLGEPSTLVPQQNHGLVISMLEQFLSQFIRQQPSPPPADYPSTPPCLGTFNFQIEPISLHINSSVPLPTHDQFNSQLNKNQSSSQQPTPPTPPPPSKQEPKQSLNPPPPPPPPEDQSRIVQPNQSLHQAPNYVKQLKVLENAGSLANLLPTGTVLAFQALAPTLSNNGRCRLTNKVLIGCIIVVCTIICFLSSFTDSFNYDGEFYYGIATRKGLLVFNYDNSKEREEKVEKELEKLKISTIDFVQALGSVAVFLIFAFSSSEVQGCYFPRQSDEQIRNWMAIYLPLVAGIVSSFLFTIFPTKRRGIGYADLARRR